LAPLTALRERWAGLARDERLTVLALLALLAIGAALRFAAMLAYRPAFIGYPDTGVYITGAREALFWDQFRVVGYSAFLRAVHEVSANLSFTTVVQHVLGLATAVLLFGGVRRAGGPPWLGLVPAAVVLLGGDQIFLEHAVLSESLYTFLIAAGLYLAARALAARPLVWLALAGAAFGLAATVRLSGLALIPLVVLWALLLPAPRRRDRAVSASVVAAGAAVVLGAYLIGAKAETDRWSFTRTGAYNFYGRVATFADCSEFDEPAGTEALCEETPPHERHAVLWYVFLGPAAQSFGEPQVGAPKREDVERVSRFARRAAVAQPLDWTDAAARDFARYVAPDAFERPDNTPEARDYPAILDDPAWVPRNLPQVSSYYDTPGVFKREGLHDALKDYEKVTALEGVPLALGMVLALLGPFLRRGRERLGALLFAGVAAAMLVVPVVTFTYDGRLGVPAYGPLAAAAAFGGLGIALAARARLRSSRG
jgi:hypothetical protein